MSTNPLKITDTILRDAHQSLLATRMSTGSMLPITEKLEAVGYYSLEMWGGATFDSAMRFLKEDPWERLRILRQKMPTTNLQMLLRGQNLLGYRHYPDDIVDKFVELSVKNGMDIFRVFDALNDTRNMAWAMQCVKKYGGHTQGAISYTISPVHNIESFVAMAKELAEMGADSICIKDMAALCTPYAAYELVKGIKEEVNLPVQFHTHNTSGFAMAAIIKTAEAGVDVVDTAISSIGGGTAQPSTEAVVASFQGTERDTGLDLTLLSEIAAYFREVRSQHLPRFETGLTTDDIRVLLYQIPGGMLSNLVSQLRQQGAENRYEEVLQELPRVRKDMGYPPLVTPTSQIVGTQAVLNVLMGERYKMIPQEVRDYCRGLYGRPPAEIDPDLLKKAVGDEELITRRPADLLEPGFESAKEEIGDLAESEEDVVSYVLFPQVAREFLELRRAGKIVPIEEPRIFPVEKPETQAVAAPAPVKTAVAPIERISQRVKTDYPMWRLRSRMRGSR
ncbi:MAG: oxaloacetate decarboxylase [Chloroflexi bacterium RBG_13_56_8]|nr:MAG: oxaloacetate decarboxylase [Chloroflexi bacterium RBG_13_56_8]